MSPALSQPMLDVIRKDPADWKVRPNLVDYDAARASFTWSSAAAGLDGLPGGRGLNIADECVDRHAAGPLADRVALRCLGRRGVERSFTYGALREETNRFANVLSDLGVAPGDRVFVLLGRLPELHVSVLGALKHRAVACSLFSAFGPEPIRQRLAIGRGSVLVTTRTLYERKVAAIRSQLADLRHILLVGDEDGPDAGAR
jgi:acetyl-CoA synthetase